MEVGQYEVEVKLDGYAVSKQNLSLSINGSNELSFTMREPSALPTAIGQAYGGGIVFELTEDGHGLVVAMNDLGEFNWEVANRKCKSYRRGGFADWYLPSKEDILMLDKVIDNVNSSLSEEGGEQIRFGSSLASYWTSTGDGTGYAWAFYFSDGSGYYYGKGSKTYVRAVRAF